MGGCGRETGVNEANKSDGKFPFMILFSKSLTGGARLERDRQRSGGKNIEERR